MLIIIIFYNFIINMNNLVSSSEQIDYFHTSFSYSLIKLLDELKNKNEHFGILNKMNKDAYCDFVDLIMNNTNLKQLYLSRFTN